jgi:hypothetical protein
VTTARALPTAPDFHNHSSFLALFRALWVIALCAALTGGFLAQVWNAPASPDASVASAPPARGHV